MSTRINQEPLLIGAQGVGPSKARLNQLAILLLTPTSLSGSQVQLIGGPFVDALGNPLSNGYLIFQLQHDAVALNQAVLPANMSVRVPLDINGFIQGTRTGVAIFIWPNTALVPAGGDYIVWAYDSSNRPAWTNPQIQVVTGTNPFNVNTWTPGP